MKTILFSEGDEFTEVCVRGGRSLKLLPFALLMPAVLLSATGCEPDTSCAETATCTPNGSDSNSDAARDARDGSLDQANADDGPGTALDIRTDPERDVTGSGPVDGRTVTDARVDSPSDDATRDTSGGVPDAAQDRGPTCTAGQKLCGSLCVSTTDPTTGCAETACTPCAFPNATAICNAAGQCAIGSCRTGFDNCNTTDPKDGCETDLSKADTCGSCTNKCTSSSPLCSGSNGSYLCVTGCMAPTSTLCGSQCVDVNTNPTHCGDCMTACMTPANGDPACASSMCDYTCHGGYHPCTATKTCASDSDINACGASCQRCVVPANGKVACTNGACAVTCNTNFHPCSANNVTTCADDNSPATCGTMSCIACPAPTDPNADPAPTCVNKTCGSKCKAGYNLCSGVCSDTNSISTCGPNCQMCSKPANASTVTCNGTSCGFTCNAGYEPSGLQCVVATNLYVSTAGSDSNAGTQASPFRTWKRAAQLAQSGTIVNFAAGTYDTLGGDDFTDAIPNGVTLQRSGAGTVKFRADGQHSLTFTGSGTVQNIAIDNFRAPFSATTGTQTIKGVTVTQQFDAIHAGGSANMVISDSSSINGGPSINRFLFVVDGSAQLTMRDTTVSGSWESCVTPSVAGAGLTAVDSATVSLVTVTFSGIMIDCVDAHASAKIALTDSTLRDTCGGGVAARDNASVVSSNSQIGAIRSYNSTNWTISGGSIGDGFFNAYGASLMSFRGVVLNAISGVAIQGAGTYDFGTSGSPGNNTFNPNSRDNGGLDIGFDGVSVEAVGNKWVPNEQGTDGNGTMPTMYLWGPVSGKNVTISTDQSAVNL